MRIEEIMTRDVATCPADATAQDAARLMAERDVGFVPVVDRSGAVLGVVTDRDLTIRVLAKGLDGKSVRLQDLVAGKVVTVTPDKDVEEARRLMREHKIQRILVVDGARKPVGVVSLQDLAKSESESEVGETVREVKQEGASIH